jgi:hypothetical protein
VEPGVYDNIGLTGGATADMTLKPGLYIVRQSFYNNSSRNIIARGVTIYLACEDWPTPCPAGPPKTSGAGFKIQGNGGLTLTAPDRSGKYPGVAIFMDRNNAAAASGTGGKVQLSSQGPLKITGTIYGVSGNFTYTSNGSPDPLYAAIVMGTVTLQSAQSMPVTYRVDQNSPYFSRARNRGLVR